MPTILIHQDGPIAQIRLNRPEVRNAMNAELIQELADAFQKIEKQKEIRVVILSGEGGFFCAGADLHWMKSFVGASQETNEKDARRLAELLSTLDNFPKPIIAKIHGAAIGGGVGLAAVADIVIAEEETLFALSEVKLGLIPAVISPYVIAKIGVSAARRYFLTGERFEAPVAQGIGLVHEVVGMEEMEDRSMEIARELLTSGPEAVKACKELIQRVGAAVSPEAEGYTVRKIAELRAGPEGQEGIQSFLEKRKPSWNV